MRKSFLALTLCAAMLCGTTALASAAPADGEYSVVCNGFYGDFDVTVAIENSVIASITTEGSHETPELGGKAIELLSEAMVEYNPAADDAEQFAKTGARMQLKLVADIAREQTFAPCTICSPGSPPVYMSTHRIIIIVSEISKAGRSG